MEKRTFGEWKVLLAKEITNGEWRTIWEWNTVGEWKNYWRRKEVWENETTIDWIKELLENAKEQMENERTIRKWKNLKIMQKNKWGMKEQIGKKKSNNR